MTSCLEDGVLIYQVAVLVDAMAAPFRYLLLFVLSLIQAPGMQVVILQQGCVFDDDVLSVIGLVFRPWPLFPGASIYIRAFILSLELHNSRLEARLPQNNTSCHG